MRHIHRHLRVHDSGALILIQVYYHYDCDILVIDDIGVHPIKANGVVDINILEEKDKLDHDIYLDAVEILQADGIC